MKSNSGYFIGDIQKNINEIKILNVNNFRFYDIIELWKFIKKFEPHIVFSLSKTTSHFALIVKHLFHKNYRLINASIRNAPINSNIYLRIEKVLYNFYDEVLSNSYAGLLAYKQLGKKGRHILYNGFNMTRVPTSTKYELRKRLGLENKFTITMVASMDDRKDHRTLIKAAHIVLNESNNSQFVLIGDGPKKQQYLNMVSSLGIENRILFRGNVDNVEEFFKASNLSVLTSSSFHGEGIPNVVVESFACGTPVIATDNGGTKEIVKDGENGYLIKNMDHGKLANLIVYLENNPSIINKLSINAKNFINKNFLAQIMLNNLCELLNNYTYSE